MREAIKAAAGGLLAALVLMVAFLSFGCARERPEVLVTRQEWVKDYLRGGEVLLVEYYVGGVPMNATFREGEDALYREWLAHLEAAGRVRVAGGGSM